MGSTPESNVFECGIEPVLQIVLPPAAAQVVAFQGDDELAARIEQLAAKSTEGQHAPEEQAEYLGYIRANKFVAILQRRARQLLSDES